MFEDITIRLTAHANRPRAGSAAPTGSAAPPQPMSTRVLGWRQTMAARQGGVPVPALSTAVGVGRVEDGADPMGPSSGS